MNRTVLLIAAIPLALATIFYVIPKTVATLFNSHTDIGLLAIVVLACGMVGFIASKIIGNEKKGNYTNEVS